MVSAEDKKLILELAKAGLSATEIAHKFDVTRLDVLAVCVSERQPVRHYWKGNSNIEKSVELLLRRGYSSYDIKRLIGIDRAIVRVVRAKLNFIGLPQSYIDRIKANKAKAAAVDHLSANGMTKKEACKQIGISPQRYYEAKKIAS